MACCVGIDWADRKHDVAVVDAGGECQEAWEVPHTAAGLAQLVARPSRLAADPRDVLIAIEQARTGCWSTRCWRPVGGERSPGPQFRHHHRAGPRRQYGRLPVGGD